MDYFGTDLLKDDADNEQFEEGSNWRECILILIDAQPSMLEPCHLPMKVFEGLTWLKAAIKIATAVQKTKILEGGRDEIGVAFYNTKLSSNTLGVDGVFIRQDLGPPDAARILDLENLGVEDFMSDIGSGSAADIARAFAIDSALWIASSMLPGSRGASKAGGYLVQRVLMATRDAMPSSDPTAACERARIIATKGGFIQLAPLIESGEKFDLRLFWSDVLSKASASAASATGGEESSVTTEDNRLYPRATPDMDDFEQILGVEALGSIVRMRAYRKRALARSTWALGPGGPVIGVKLYSTIQKSWPAVKGQKAKLHAADYTRLVPDRVVLDDTTGIPLEKHQLPRLYYPKLDKDTQVSFPRVYATSDEIAALKWPITKGISLLGFKPMKLLAPWHQLRESTFCYPDEKSVPGSAKAFSALLSAASDRGVFAVCAFVRSPSAEPRLVAAVPQKETRDEDGSQITPPGFHLIYLPYADDIRYPIEDPEFTLGVGGGYTAPSEGAVSAAGDLIDALQLGHEFDSSDIPNPHLQRWFEVLESVVLREAHGAMAEPRDQPEDLTLPDMGAFKAAEGLVRHFIGSICTTGEEEAKLMEPGKKRKAAEAGLSAEQVAELNVPEMAANGKLSNLTNDQLKAWLGHHGESKTGKKADLVARIMMHLEKTSN